MLYVEIADTPHKQAKGLMFRDKLERDSGMLFKFDRPSPLNFWNMNTFIPLDIAFISPEGRITKISRIPPIKHPMRQTTVSSDGDCQMAIEANEGYFENNGIIEGMKIKLSKSNDGFDCVVFEDE